MSRKQRERERERERARERERERKHLKGYSEHSNENVHILKKENNDKLLQGKSRYPLQILKNMMRK